MLSDKRNTAAPDFYHRVPTDPQETELFPTCERCEFCDFRITTAEQQLYLRRGSSCWCNPEGKPYRNRRTDMTNMFCTIDGHDLPADQQPCRCFRKADTLWM